MQQVRQGRKPPPDLASTLAMQKNLSFQSTAHTPAQARSHHNAALEPPLLPPPPPPPPHGHKPLTKDECMKIINSEFRSLQLDSRLTTMSVFDLIDHCSSLFEDLKEHAYTTLGLKSYVRAYLIFNYFINSFIMVHFEGFDRFLKLNQQDFIIYLNLYNFFRREDIIGRNVFDIDLDTLQLHMDEYLTSHNLLSFDIQELFGWLNEYIEFLKHKDDDSEEEEEDDLGQGFAQPAVSKPYYQTEPTNLLNLSEIIKQGDPAGTETDPDMFDFANRFPEVAETPYPVRQSRLSLTEPTLDKHYTQSQNNSSRHGNGHRQDTIPPVPHIPPVPQVAPTPHSHHPQAMRSQEKLSSAPSVQSLPVNGEAMAYGNNGNSFYHQNRSHIQLPNHQQPAYPQNFQYQNSFPNNHMHMLPQIPHAHQFVAPPVPHSNGTYSAPYSGPMMNPQKAHTTSNLQAMDVQRARYQERVQKTEWLRSHSICGLKNLGSSCYINLTIQVMFGVSRFVSLFSKRSNNNALAKAMSLTKNKTILTEAIVGLLSTFQASGGSVIAPTKFMRVVSLLKPSFNIPFEQQDAQEFLLFIIDKVHEELARQPNEDMLETDYVRKWGVDVTPMEKEEYHKWYRALMKAEGVSPVNDLCQGHVRSQLVCNKCGCTSNSYSSFSMLSLPIPSTHLPVVDLIDCLRYYTQDETLSGENAWKCPRCNKTEGDGNPMDVVFQQKRSLKPWKNKSSKKPKENGSPMGPISIKKLSIIKLPPVLFIHLSRFSMFSMTDKLNATITYPLRLKFNHQTEDVHYSLVGLINHFGNLKSGHYTSLVNKSRDKTDRLLHPEWCYFDDENFRLHVPHGDVRTEGAKRLHSRDVYVLCYERVS